MTIAAMTDRDFTKEVLQGTQPVLVACRASWCVPSQQLIPNFESIAKQYDGRVKVVAVDMDTDSEGIRKRFNVTRLPVTMLFHHGTLKDFIGGATSEESITQMIDKQLSPVMAVDELNFDREVIASRVPVVVHFTARWCSASLKLLPDVEALATRFQGRARVAQVEFGPETARLCARFNVVRVPTVALFVDGKVVDQVFGAMVGGTKTEAVRTSCVGLTSVDNLGQMLQRFVA